VMPVVKKKIARVVLQNKLAIAYAQKRGTCLLSEEVVALVALLKELGYEEEITSTDQSKNPRVS
jgi:predicted ArsR family transcriptional regulator